jgi:hypothetical protein
MKMRVWAKDKLAICRDISARKCKLVLILKTKDDPTFLKKWIDHHVSLSEDIQIVIADNGSSDPSVVDILNDLPAEIILFRYNEFHDFIHHRNRFSELYDAIAISAAHYAVIDTDEFLLSVDGNQVIKDGVGKALPQLKPGCAQALPWLPNVAGTDRAFVFGNSKTMCNLLRYGKPILPSVPPNPKTVDHGIIHNAHVPRSWYAHHQIGGLFVLHLPQYSTEQRLRANHNKLIARGVDLRGKSITEVSEFGNKEFKDHTVNRLINEIKVLMSGPYPTWIPDKLAEDALMIDTDGQIKYGSEAGRNTFLNFLEHFQDLVGTYLGSEQERDPRFEGLDAPAMQAAGEAAMAGRDINLARQIFRNGLMDHPKYLDHHGHPYFRKELLRSLLDDGRFEAAEGFYPIPGSPGGDRWHEILVARALDKDGKRGAATGYWRRVLQHSPNNAEAIDRLR